MSSCTAKNYGSLSLKALRAELKTRKAKLSGRKHELVERLESYDRNFNFGHIHCEDECFQMATPEASRYLDINTDSQIPEVSEKNVRAFHALHEQDLCEKAESLYYGKFLHSIRYCIQDDSTFIRGRVSAEMKTKVLYKVDLKLNVHGVIEESQCECAVGMGPEAHCKHVAVVYCAVCNKNKKEGIVTKDTCTDLLQTFHQPKKYSGSPVRMSELKLRKKETIHQLKDFDPRPLDSRNRPEYPDIFRNVWLNSQAKDLPIRQLYPPANIGALNNDHDYMEKTHEEQFLHDVHVTSISKEQCAATEEATRGQSTNKTWKEERNMRLHASNFGRICKATSRTDLNKMAQSLTVCKDFTSKYTNHGKKYESVAVKDYCTLTGNKVEFCGIHVCTEYPYIGCSPDGLVGSEGLIEVKCPYTCKDHVVCPENFPYLKYESSGNLGLTLNENHNYFYQVQGNLLCTKRQWCDFIVWTFKDVQIIRIQRDNEFINNLIVKLKSFFDQHFRQAVLDKYFYRETHKYSICQMQVQVEE